MAEYKPRAGAATGAVEAPRGVLYHQWKWTMTASGLHHSDNPEQRQYPLRPEGACRRGHEGRENQPRD